MRGVRLHPFPGGLTPPVPAWGHACRSLTIGGGIPPCSWSILFVSFRRLVSRYPRLCGPAPRCRKRGPAGFCLGTKCARRRVNGPAPGGGEAEGNPREGAFLSAPAVRGDRCPVEGPPLLFVRRRLCAFGGSAVPGAVLGLLEPEPFALRFWRERFPHVCAFYKVLGATVRGVASPPPLSLCTQWFFFFLLLYFGRRVGKKERKKKITTSSFVGCGKASWDSWPAQAGKQESG